MNRAFSQSLRLKQLSDRPPGLQPVNEISIPQGGWLRAIRQALGLTLKSLGDRVHLSPQSIHQFEISEARGSISLRQLEEIAGAMGCRVVYALVPISGTLLDLAHATRSKAQQAVQHTMALEGQAVDHPETMP